MYRTHIYTVKCDICGMEVKEGNISARGFRKKLRAIGWKIRIKKLCPKCKDAMCYLSLW